MVRGWIRLAYRGGSLLGRLGVHPDRGDPGRAGALPGRAVRRGGRPGGPDRWPRSLVLAAGFADAFDGAVAVVTGRTSRAGFVIDSVADRVGEARLAGRVLGGRRAGLAGGRRRRGELAARVPAGPGGRRPACRRSAR